MNESLNKKMEPTPREKTILCSLAKNGLLSPWDLSHEDKQKKQKKIASYKTVNKGCHHLDSLGLVKLKKEPLGIKGRRKKGLERDQLKQRGIEIHEPSPFLMGRKKDYYGLTFHGVLYTLSINAFSEEEAAGVRLRNYADVPLRIEPPTTPILKGSEDQMFPALIPEVQELFPRTMRLELERVRLMLETFLRPEKQLYENRIRKIDSEARRNKTDIKLFSFIEQKYSKRIYEVLSKKVNPTPRGYDENHASAVFNEQRSDCFNELFLQFLGGDKKAFQEMTEVLKDDYSVDVLQKLFGYWSRLHETLLKAEPDSDPKLLEVWRIFSEWSSEMSKTKPEDLRNLVSTSGPKAILEMKKYMNEL